MEKEYKSTTAVQGARICIAVLSWIAIAVGVFVLLPNLFEPAGWAGATLIVLGIGGLIIKALLKGFEAIVRACEEYMNSQD